MERYVIRGKAFSEVKLVIVFSRRFIDSFLRACLSLTGPKSVEEGKSIQNFAA